MKFNSIRLIDHKYMNLILSLPIKILLNFYLIKRLNLQNHNQILFFPMQTLLFVVPKDYSLLLHDYLKLNDYFDFVLLVDVLVGFCSRSKSKSRSEPS